MDLDFITPGLLDPLSPFLNLDTPIQLVPTPDDLCGMIKAKKSSVGGGTFDGLFEQVMNGDLEDRKMSFENPCVFSATSVVVTPPDVPFSAVLQKTVKFRVPPPPVRQRVVPKLHLERNQQLERKKRKRIVSQQPAPVGRKKPKRKRKRKMTQEQYEKQDDENENEGWERVYCNKSMLDIVEQCEIACKTRCEDPTFYVPKTLYSSLKYELKCNLVCGLPCSYPFILGRVKVVHADRYEEIVKDGRTVLKGVFESALTKKDDVYEGKFKVQFTDVSYHHKKHDLRWEIHFFAPEDLKNPILIERSAPFKVFARKPSNAAGKKRKRTIGSFTSKLNELVRCAKKLKVGEKQEAFQMITKRLRELDPNFFKTFSNPKIYTQGKTKKTRRRR